MALPQNEADWKRAAEAVRNTSYEHLVDLSRPLHRMMMDGPPKLRGWWFRQWCGLRGHGGITHLPGSVFYFRDGLCKRCGSRVTVNGDA